MLDSLMAQSSLNKLHTRFVISSRFGWLSTEAIKKMAAIPNIIITDKAAGVPLNFPKRMKALTVAMTASAPKIIDFINKSFWLIARGLLPDCQDATA